MQDRQLFFAPGQNRSNTLESVCLCVCEGLCRPDNYALKHTQEQQNEGTHQNRFHHFLPLAMGQIPFSKDTLHVTLL